MIITVTRDSDILMEDRDVSNAVVVGDELIYYYNMEGSERFQLDGSEVITFLEEGYE